MDRDTTVSDEIWDELQNKKRIYQAEIKQIKQTTDQQGDQKVKKGKKDVLKTKTSKTIKKMVNIQDKIKKIGKCSQGYIWFQVGGGWRCAGGSHFVSDAELRDRYSE